MLNKVVSLVLVLPWVQSQSYIELSHTEGVCADMGYANIMSTADCRSALLELNYTEGEAHVTWDKAETIHPTGCTLKIDDRQGHLNPGLNGVANPNFLNICIMNGTTMGLSTAAGTPAPTKAMSENMTTAAPSPSSPSPSPFLSPAPSSEAAGAADVIPCTGAALVAAITALRFV